MFLLGSPSNSPESHWQDGREINTEANLGRSDKLWIRSYEEHNQITRELSTYYLFVFIEKYQFQMSLSIWGTTAPYYSYCNSDTPVCMGLYRSAWDYQYPSATNCDTHYMLCCLKTH